MKGRAHIKTEKNTKTRYTKEQSKKKDKENKTFGKEKNILTCFKVIYRIVTGLKSNVDPLMKTIID